MNGHSGYTHCACRDCFEVAIADDTRKPALCWACERAGCSGEPTDATWPAASYDCQRTDAYESEGHDHDQSI